MTKETLLQQTDPKIIIDCIAKFWPKFPDEEEEELCIEEIYDIIAHNAALPENYNLLADEEKAQLEIDIDMELITIEYSDIGKHVFKGVSNEAYFWSLIEKTTTHQKHVRKLFAL